MKIFSKSIVIFILGLFLGFKIQAQQMLSLYYLETIPQVQNLNPAMAPRANGYLGIPFAGSTYFGVNTDMFGSEMVQKYNGDWVTLTNAGYDYDPFYKRIGKAANISAHQVVVPIQFGFRGKKGYFSFSWSEKVNMALAIPKDFFTILDEGGFPDGSAYDFSAFGVNGQYYREMSFGYSYKIMSKLRVGFHAKFLQGLAAVKTDISKFDVNTGVDQWDIALKADAYISSPVEISTDSTGYPNGIGDLPSTTKEIIDMGLLNFSNPGIAGDFGAVYEHNEAWTFSAALNDLGFIKWNGGLHSYSASGSYTFKGLYLDSSNIDSLDVATGELLDSLKNAIKSKSGNESFTTGLGPKLYIGAKYNVNHYFSLGALSRTVFAKNDFQQEFNVSANLNLYRILSTTVNYTYSINGANTFGFGLALRGGPVQFYVAADYLPYAYRNYTIETTSDDDANSNSSAGKKTRRPITPASFDNFNVMFGLNILFGAKGFRDEPMMETNSGF
jgi:hypothetical protein